MQDEFDLSTLAADPKNPRKISNEQFAKLQTTLKKFGDLSGIIKNVETNQLVGGHMRLEAFKNDANASIEITQRFDTPSEAGTVALGYVKVGNEHYSYREVSWPLALQRAANVAANHAGGEDDRDLLAELIYELSEMENGDELLNLTALQDKEIKDLLAAVSGEDGEQPEYAELTDTFIVPPFSILDTKQGYWQSRARAWGDKIGDVSATREGTLGLTSLAGDKYGGKAFAASGVSELDPVLCEVSYKWFTPQNGMVIFNPFGGEPVSAFVAAHMGYRYHGTEIRPEQVEETYRKIGMLNEEQKAAVNLQVGDARQCAQVFAGTTADLIFSSPPFYDLEVYSDRAEDMSNLGTYEQFMESYKQAFAGAVSLLNNDRFVVINVTEIRDKHGVYRNFVGDNVKLFTDLGLHFYNDIIIANAIGTAAIRAARNMSSRKVVRIHQNLLIFYKGDVANIKNNFPALEVELPPELDALDKEAAPGDLPLGNNEPAAVLS